MDVYAAIHHRRSHRSYRPEIPPREILERIIAAALWAPSGMNLQGWEITLMAGKARDDFVALVSQAVSFLLPRLKQADFSEAAQQQVIRFFKDLGGAPVVAAVTIFQATDPQARKSMIQSGAALMQNLLLAAEAEGLGTCWMAGANYLEDEILKFLGKTNQELLAITPIGYPAKEPPPPPRKPREVRWLGFEN
jgi:nitroreductase